MRLFLAYTALLIGIVFLQSRTGGTINADMVVVATSTPVATSSLVYKDFKLKVPYYHQQYPNSCEAASLRMALAYKGILKNDIQIVTQFTYKPTIKDYKNNIWTDPQKQYVGFVDIAGRPNGGYGVYGLPVLKAVQAFGRTGEYATGTAITAQFLTKELDAKNPVVIWGYTSFREAPYTWKTTDGTIVKAMQGEHARLVVGYKGTAAKPVGFYVHDPFTGKANEYWTTAKLMDHMQKVPGVTDQAVTVR
ncbi:MAG: C39 family peptidase [Patescibacteria group bacterium]